MKIETYISAELTRRLERRSCLVVYDPEKRLGGIVKALSSGKTKVVDAGASLVLGREEALDAWCRLADEPGSRLLVYLPWEKPKDDYGKRENAFAPFELGGAVFPEGDGDQYRELCIRAFPGREGEVRRLFAEGEPSFEVVNGLAGGAVYPNLKALLGVESEREMLLVLTAPPSGLLPVLEKGGAWLAEARGLAKSVLGLDAKAADWKSFQEALGRFLLFSEFVLDLPGELPASLKSVPRAAAEKKAFVDGLCEALRDSKATRPAYREIAERIETGFGLAEKFEHTADLGVRETFAFETRASLSRCTSAALAGDYDEARRIIEAGKTSVWYDCLEDVQSYWACLGSAVSVLDRLSAFAALEEDRITVEDFLRAYADLFSLIDAEYRGFELYTSGLTASDSFGLEELLERIRTDYYAAAEALQRDFLSCVEKDSWPGPEKSDAGGIFAARLAPRLEAREKTAFFMIDAFRYDLARELLLMLPKTYTAQLDRVRGRLPSVTPVGMAALLPGAEKKLAFTVKSGALIPKIGSEQVATAQDRVAYLKSVYGDRIFDVVMNDLETLKKADLGDQVQLLVVRSTEIDAAGESMGPESLHLLSHLIRNILRGLDRVRRLGFTRAVIATDHGFLLQPSKVAGGTIAKPEGVWEAAGSRHLLGEGSKNASVKAFDAASIGISGYEKLFVTPNGLGCFSGGSRYVHGGLSLQECALPVVTVDFPAQAPKKAAFGVTLGYRGGMTRKITTMRPSLDLSVSHPEGGDLFGGALEHDLALLLTVREGDKEVGRAQPAAGFDPGSGIVKIKPGQAMKVTLVMNEDHRGPFTVSVLDPLTLEQFARLDLETDYTE